MRQNKFSSNTIFFLVFLVLILFAVLSPVIFAAIPPEIQVTSPANGQALNSASFPVVGMADAGVSVAVYLDEAYVGSTITDFQGSWSMNVGPVAEGSHTLYAQACDDLGNIGMTTPITFQVDLTVPNLSITTPQTGTYVYSPVIEGQTEPGASVTVYVYDREAIVTADVYGHWLYTDTALPEGSHSVSAMVTDGAGNSQVSSTVYFNLDMTRPRVLPDIFPPENMTQVALDTVMRVYLEDVSPLDPIGLQTALNLVQRGESISESVYGTVYGTVYENNDVTVSGTVYTAVYGSQGKSYLEVIFKPDSLLETATTYAVYVNPELSDAAGNLIYPRSWQFTTVGGIATENPHGHYIDNVNVCGNCHTTHRARFPEIAEPRGMPVALIDDYCLACHDGTTAPTPDNWNSAMRHDYRTYREGTTGPSACTACHNPHLRWTPENPNLLQDFYFYDHNDPTNPYLPDSSEQALCELCHESTIVDDSRVLYQQYWYNQRHTATGAFGDYSLCLCCHDGTFASDIASYYKSASRHFLVAKDGSKLNGHLPCSDCHASHGSSNYWLLREELGHNRVQPFQALSSVWNPLTERRFCTGCHNNTTEVYGVVAGFVYGTPGHEPSNSQGCSVCHGGSPQAAAHGPQ